MEALKNEVGDSWLSVLGEREMATERSNKLSSDEDLQRASASSSATKPAVVAQAPMLELVGKELEVKVVKGKKKKKKGKKKSVLVVGSQGSGEPPATT